MKKSWSYDCCFCEGPYFWIADVRTIQAASSEAKGHANVLLKLYLIPESERFSTILTIPEKCQTISSVRGQLPWKLRRISTLPSPVDPRHSLV